MLTVPLFVVTILECQVVFSESITSYTKDSTAEDFVLDDKICFSTTDGNTREWLMIEICTFYCNIATLIYILIKARCCVFSQYSKATI